MRGRQGKVSVVNQTAHQSGNGRHQIYIYIYSTHHNWTATNWSSCLYRWKVNLRRRMIRHGLIHVLAVGHGVVSG